MEVILQRCHQHFHLLRPCLGHFGLVIGKSHESTFSASSAIRRFSWMSLRRSGEVKVKRSYTTIIRNGPNVIVEELRGITLIGLNRPEKRNCVNPDTAKELIEAFKNFEENSESPAAVLYGKGGVFCAGYDLEYLASLQAESGSGVSGDKLCLDEFFFNPESPDGVGPMGPSRRFFKKPVVAAIAGYAVAGGLELALMCDLRVAEETAIFGVYCRRFGVPLIDGGTVRLPQVIGLGRAMDMICTGRSVKGKEAFEIGLANRITSVGTSLGQGIQLATSLIKYPQECLNRDRASAYNAMFNASSFSDAIAYEMRNGIKDLKKEAIPGADSFVRGIGRHGSFRNLISMKDYDDTESIIG